MYPQTLHALFWLPLSLQVDDLTVSHSPKLWPAAGISSCALITALHTAQWLPAVFPAVVQVAATATSSTSVWPAAGISSCALITALHTEQWLPAVFPAVVQVAATAASSTSVWPVAGIVSVSASSQRLHFRSLVPGSVHVAFFVTFHSPVKSCPKASIAVLSFTSSQFLQWIDLLPSAVQVGS